MRVLWLPDVLRSAGLDVVEHDGWRNRGRELQSVEGVVAHHTATGKTWSDDRVVRLLIEGRPDLPGPLCQLGLDRSGTFHLIAAGKGNHNGKGLWGNQSIGIEAFNDGRGEAWVHVQLAAYIRGCAAICRHLGWPESKVKAHRETDPGRKPDPVGIDMDDFRLGVAGFLKTKPAPPQEEDEMQFRAIRRVEDNKVALVAANYFRPLTTVEELEAMIAGGLCQQPSDEVNAAEWDRIKATALNQ